MFFKIFSFVFEWVKLIFVILNKGKLLLELLKIIVFDKLILCLLEILFRVFVLE